MTPRQRPARRDPLDEPDDLLAGDEPEPAPGPEPAATELDQVEPPAEEPAWDAGDDVGGTALDERDWDDLVDEAPRWPEEGEGGDEVAAEQDRLIPDEEWAELEDEARLLPPGAVVVGLREVAALPAHGGVEVVALMNTGLAASALHAPFERVDGLARLWLGERELRLSLVDDVARLELTVAGRSVEVSARLTGRHAEEPLELGRDVLEAGRLLVDAGRSFLHRSSGAVPWRM